MKTQTENQKKNFATEFKVGDNVRFSNLNSPEWNPNCHDGNSKIKGIKDGYIVFENGFCLHKNTAHFLLYNSDGKLQFIID